MTRREKAEELLADEIEDAKRERAKRRAREAAFRRKLRGDDPRESVGVSWKD